MKQVYVVVSALKAGELMQKVNELPGEYVFLGSPFTYDGMVHQAVIITGDGVSEQAHESVESPPVVTETVDEQSTNELKFGF